MLGGEAVSQTLVASGQSDSQHLMSFYNEVRYANQLSRKQIAKSLLLFDIQIHKLIFMLDPSLGLIFIEFFQLELDNHEFYEGMKMSENSRYSL